MASWLRRSVSLMALVALSAIGFAEPAHVLFYVSKRVVSPVRHPLKSAHSVWKFLAEVF